MMKNNRFERPKGRAALKQFAIKIFTPGRSGSKKMIAKKLLQFQAQPLDHKIMIADSLEYKRKGKNIPTKTNIFTIKT